MRNNDNSRHQGDGKIIGAEPRKLRTDGTVCIPDNILSELGIDPSESYKPSIVGFSNGVVKVQFDIDSRDANQEGR